jgi:hypothetical protein
MLGHRLLEPSAETIQSRAEVALVSVSSVPNVLDEMMNSVCSGSEVAGASAKSVESTLDTNRNDDVPRGVVPQRLVRHHRPRSEPPMPTLTTFDRLAGDGPSTPRT